MSSGVPRSALRRVLRREPSRVAPAAGAGDPPPSAEGDEARWTHLMNTAFHLQQEEGPHPERRQAAIRESLDSALEAFPPAEPLVDYPGFAVRRLLLALRQSLNEPLTPGAATPDREG